MILNWVSNCNHLRWLIYSEWKIPFQSSMRVAYSEVVFFLTSLISLVDRLSDRAVYKATSDQLWALFERL